MSAARYPTTYKVRHFCGHVQEHDLRAVDGPRRQGRANYRAGGPCDSCYHEGLRRPGDSPEETAAPTPASDATTTTARPTVAGAAARSDVVVVAPGANEWYQRRALPALEGTAREIELAVRYRTQILTGAWAIYEAENWEPNEFVIAVEQPACRVLTAHWWIENRAVSPDELVDALERAAKAEQERGS